MKINKKGFTLVELLIVIGLLGAIALIVIAAINPIEQANRARDTRYKADGAQLISAIDRYFAARSEFPWVSAELVAGNELAYGFVPATDQGVGLCGESCTGDTGDGLLLTSEELKTEFKNRDFVKNYDSDDPSSTIFIGKSTSASGSVYACFVPLAKSTKKDAVENDKVVTISDSGTRTPTDLCDADDAVWTGTSMANSCFVCVPE